jgi:hypothetical protein
MYGEVFQSFTHSKTIGKRLFTGHLITQSQGYKDENPGRLTPNVPLQVMPEQITFFSYGSTALYGPGPPRFVDASRSHTLDTPRSVGLLWTRDQPVAETST